MGRWKNLGTRLDFHSFAMLLRSSERVARKIQARKGLEPWSAMLVQYSVAWWWEQSSPTNVARVQFPDLGWLCWFSSLLWVVFPWVLRFSPRLNLIKINLICINFNLQCPQWDNKYLVFIIIIISIIIITLPVEQSSQLGAGHYLGQR